MKVDQTPEEYRAELVVELTLLKRIQLIRPNEYRARRIATLEQRIDLLPKKES